LSAHVVLSGAAAAGQAAGNPVPPGVESLIGDVYVSPGISPPGANDFTCKPSAAHPDPVVLVHGTLFDQTLTWNLMAPVLEH
jgi:hypothetical protein